MENLVNIGTIVGTHHLLGTVKVNSIFEDIELILGEKVLVEKGDEKKLLLIKKIKHMSNKKILVDFEGINNIDLAKNLNGFAIKIRRDLLPPKNENEFYIKDLLGLAVYDSNELIGHVIDVMETAAHNILIVRDNDEKECLIPNIDEFVKNIDFVNDKIIVELIEGMRE